MVEANKENRESENNAKKVKGKSNFAFKSILDGTILTKQNIVNQAPFLLYLFLLGLIYIGNSYNSEKTIIEINKTKEQNKELRYNYIVTKSQLMFFTRQSEVIKRLENKGIAELDIPPSKIIVETE